MTDLDYKVNNSIDLTKLKKPTLIPLDNTMNTWCIDLTTGLSYDKVQATTNMDLLSRTWTNQIPRKQKSHSKTLVVKKSQNGDYIKQSNLIDSLFTRNSNKPKSQFKGSNTLLCNHSE
jgi:hypothetical protein